MSAQEAIRAIHAEIDGLEQRLGVLRQAADLLGTLEDASEAVAPAAAPPSERRPARKPERAPRALPPRSPGAGDKRAKVLAAVIDARRPVRVADVVAATGISNGYVKQLLRSLVDDGRVIAEGATKARRYRPAEHVPHTEVRAKVDASKERNEDDMTRRVRRVKLRDAVLKAIAADPGALNDRRLAQALNEDLDEVAMLTCALLEKGVIRVEDGGVYRRTAAAANGIAA